MSNEDPELPRFDGLLSMLNGWDSASGGGLPLILDYQPAPAPELDWLAPPPESAGWSWEEWQRFAGINLVRGYEQSMDASLFGAGMREVSWEYAASLYDRAQAEARREAAEQFARETRLYWSGRPDPVTRRILRAYGLTAQQIGLVQRSAFTGEYRRRQRARVKRRRR